MYFSVALLTTLIALPTALSVAVPEAMPLSPDPAGAKNVGNGHGGQFIGGACLSQADCASACCATLNGAGICSGPGAQFQAGKTGCGFGGVSAAAPPPPPSNSAPTTSTSSSGFTIVQTIPGSQNVGKANGQQFITGQCTSNADCASTCCAGLPGAGNGPTFAVCSGPAVGNDAGKTGCGFTLSGGSVAAAPAAPAAPSTGKVPIDTSIPGSQLVGNQKAQQFITGQCINNADCASGCCAGLPTANQGPLFAVCSGPAVGNQAGKTGCGFNANVSAAITTTTPPPPAASTSTDDGADEGCSSDDE
ncbi:MAG: hypothetical protein GOMPHAMPRED_007239 [Gomphillus americanus]|uniref:Biotrophy-associated secreted protein 2 n=1 Tax=Gomphillus americanus TaxID=1940652 RepID=A0A8H3EY38_9LECA|nr:MAG: hypothetical protein GOMPHAMPRED_007239 [Gomphillus americanus]